MAVLTTALGLDEDGSVELTAANIPVVDAGTVFTATDVEAVLAELEARVAALEAA